MEMNEQIQGAGKDIKNEYMRDYMKKWRRNNPKKAKDIQDRYWQKRADQKCADKQ